MAKEVKSFSKMYIYHFLDIFCKHFHYLTGFFNELSNYVSIVILGHQKWDLVLKYPSRDRVKENILRKRPIHKDDC